MTFRPKIKGDIRLILGTAGYQKAWDEEGAKVLATFKDITGFAVDRRHITAEIVSGYKSNSGYGRRHMELAVNSIDYEQKVATLMHELAHRLLTTNDIYIRKRKLRYWRNYRKHQMIYLFLYDAMLKLYGKKFADAEVKRDGRYATYYPRAWKWALAKTPEQRRRELVRIVTKKEVT